MADEGGGGGGSGRSGGGVYESFIPLILRDKIRVLKYILTLEVINDNDGGKLSQSKGLLYYSKY